MEIVAVNSNIIVMSGKLMSSACAVGKEVDLCKRAGDRRVLTSPASWKILPVPDFPRLTQRCQDTKSFQSEILKFMLIN